MKEEDEREVAVPVKLTQIRDLIAIANHGSMRGAARHLDIDQPAISRSIRLLEQELGVTLLDRSSAGVTLTPLGETFVRRVNLVQNEISRACDEVRQISGKESGRVAIGLAMGPLFAMVPKVLPGFRRRYPKVQLEISEGLLPSLSPALISGDMDFYVGPAMQERPGTDLQMETLYENYRLVFARHGHPLLTATSIAELREAEWVSTAASAYDDVELDPFFSSHGLDRPQISISTSSAMSMMMVAASTDLLALMPQQWVLFANATGLLAPIPIAEKIRARHVGLVTRAKVALTPAAEHLSDLFRRAALNQPDYSTTTAGLPLIG